MRVIALSLAFALAACASSVRVAETQATPQMVERLAAFDWVDLQLHNGARARLSGQRDFGDAVCSNSQCVRKADIVSFRYPVAEVDIDRTAANVAAAPFMAPVVALGAAATMQPGGGEAAPPDSGNASRMWLDSRLCCAPTPSPRCPTSVRANTSDAEAAEQIWRDRHELPGGCLWSAVELYRHLEVRSRAMSIYALAAVRVRWDSARCGREERPHYATPPDWSDLGPRRGDPEMLALMNRMFDYTRAYESDDRYLAEFCGERGVRPRSEWGARISFVRAQRPLPESP